MFQDRKIKRLLRAAGGKGFTVYVYLLTLIYREDGYFLAWDDDLAFDVADDLNFPENVVEESIHVCCAHGLFHKEMFTEMGVLSSESIQVRWQKIVTDAKRKDTDIDPRYRIEDGIALFLRENKVKTPEEIPITTEETPQSKVKESKVKESKGEYGADAPAHKPACLDETIAFFTKNGGDENMAFEFYHTYESQKWVKKNGRAITSWQSAAALWIKRELHDKPIWKQKPRNGHGIYSKSKGDQHADALRAL